MNSTFGLLRSSWFGPEVALNRLFPYPLITHTHSAPWSDGPEVEHGAHFLILYYPYPLAAGTLNIHPSLLPQFRGAAPVQR